MDSVLNYNFEYLKSHKGSTITSGLSIFLCGVGSINHEDSMIKIDDVSMSFACLKHSKSTCGHSFFFKCFKEKMCIIHFQNWRGLYYWWLKEKNELKLVKFMLTTYFSAFSSNLLLALKIMNFEDVSWTKVIHFWVIKKMDA